MGPGLFFADGKRKVDYVLCYKYKKRRASKARLSISSNGSIPVAMLGGMESETEPGEAGAAAEAEESKLTEEEKALMREEFEAGLLEAGLQIERDKEVCNCFVATLKKKEEEEAHCLFFSYVLTIRANVCVFSRYICQCLCIGAYFRVRAGFRVFACVLARLLFWLRIKNAGRK